jgi:hypothetical protein
VDEARAIAAITMAFVGDPIVRWFIRDPASRLEATSPVNKPLYERHGFEQIGVIQSGDSSIWPMVRKPGCHAQRERGSPDRHRRTSARR